jgi:hypothetical protein
MVQRWKPHFDISRRGELEFLAVSLQDLKRYRIAAFAKFGLNQGLYLLCRVLVATKKESHIASSSVACEAGLLNIVAVLAKNLANLIQYGEINLP